MAIDCSPASTPPPRFSLAVRFVHGLTVALIAVLLLPYVLTPLYAIVPPVSAPMLWRWLTGVPVVRTYVPLDAMAPSLPLTVVVSEDARFCRHNGVDWRGVWTAIEDADDFTEVRGGSTITQQTAKNLFLWGGRSYLRKALELPLALWMDFVLSKRRILEIYLNTAQWGPGGEFGAEAGARRAFGRSVRHLAPGEAALLAAMLPNPLRRDARRPGPGLHRLAAIYQARAAAAGDLNGCFRARR